MAVTNDRGATGRPRRNRGGKGKSGKDKIIRGGTGNVFGGSVGPVVQPPKGNPPHTTGAGSAGTGNVPGPPSPTTPPEEGRTPPEGRIPDGYEWVWDDDAQEWSLEPIEGDEEDDVDGDLFARLRNILDFWGLSEHPEAETFIKDSLRFGWGENEFRQNLRQSQVYLSNPLFRANIERAKAGKGFLAEEQVIAWGTEARRLAKQFGYLEPSANFLAMGLESGLSMAEIEHRLQVQDRINLYGGGVKAAAKEMGFNVDDPTLFDIFDVEKDTKEWDDMFRRAQMSGRPVTLGLGRRSADEVRFAEMLGIGPDEYFKRMEAVAGNRSRFERLGTIEENVRKGLPGDFGSHLMTAENGLLIRGLVFNDPAALAELQEMTAREIARFKTGGGAVKTGAGQAVGLLSGAERESLS
jgi:stalled ribosome alternative rescue factor ArfA